MPPQSYDGGDTIPHSHRVLIAEGAEVRVFLLERSLRKIVTDGERRPIFGRRLYPQISRLAVLDIKMALKDGFDVLKRVRANPKLGHMPVIISSKMSAFPAQVPDLTLFNPF